MRTLLLMRHAKSSRDVASLGDHDRPLNGRGRRAAPEMGLWLRSLGVVPERILSSTALRAVQTARAVAEASGYAGEIQTTRRLYLAAPEDICEAISELEDDLSPLLVVAHNPGLEELVSFWARSEERLPTAAVARFDVPIPSWAALGPKAQARLSGIWRPKDLVGASD